MAGELEFFGYQWLQVGSPPDWHKDAWTHRTRESPHVHWSEAREFAVQGLDIKAVWEPSRFEWAVVLARAYATTANEQYLRTLCSWLDSWIQHNPLNSAPNWKCGQETSIRLLRFLETLHLLRWPDDANEGIEEFVYLHLRRVELTLSYAVAQDNNHGTSEAAALFVGAQWLLRGRAVSRFREYASAIATRGASQLIERVLRLVAEDGTFSQYSVNYQRMFLDTMALVECWCRRLGSVSPLIACRTHVEAALQWLTYLVDTQTGDAPNLGGNDGALLLVSPATAFRDHRPTLQLCSCLFRGARQYAAGPWDDASRYWGIEPNAFPHRAEERRSRLFPASIAFLFDETEQSWAVLRLPVYRFRPSQADALHLDIWVRGENVVRDSGTFSYNADARTYAYFAGTRGHSTVEFDGRDQMPRISRFLFARWLSAEQISFRASPEQYASAEYRDHQSARHKRTVRLLNSKWLVEDELSGIAREGVLRWHLAPGRWVLMETGALGPGVRIDVSSSAQLRISLETQWESRYYMKRTEVPVLEIRVNGPRAKVITVISLNP